MERPQLHQAWLEVGAGSEAQARGSMHGGVRGHSQGFSQTPVVRFSLKHGAGLAAGQPGIGEAGGAQAFADK